MASAPSDLPDDATPATLDALRAIIDAKLRDQGIYTQLRSLIQTHTTTSVANDDGSSDWPADDRVLHTLLESDVVQQLIASIQPPSSLSSSQQPSAASTTPESLNAASDSADKSRFFSPVMHVRVLGGKAFVDSLLDDASGDQVAAAGGQNTPSSRTCLRFDVAFQNQRHQSRFVPCSVDPPFDEAMAFTLYPAPSSSGMVALSKWESLCAIQEPIHWTITNHVQTHGSTTDKDNWQDVTVELVAAATLDWRQWLTSPHPVVHLPLTLQGPMKVPVGLLNLRLDLPSVHKSTATTYDAKQRLQKEVLAVHGTQSHLYQYCKQWWADYVRDHAVKSSSHWVRLFVEDDTHRYKLVCTYVTPLQSIHVTTPSEAARFVSLLPFVRATSVGSGRDTTWHSMATFLAIGYGDCEEHAILLASLLLGFGLQSYVCMGTRRRQPFVKKSAASSADSSVRHVWVATILSSSVMLWEAVTGECVAATAPTCPYDRVDCVFNHECFYANCQDTDQFAEIDWTLQNAALWKALDPTLIAQVGARQPSISLRPPRVVTATDDDHLDRALRQWLQSTRHAHGLSATKWHPNLSHYIRMALTSYEVERVFGASNVDNVYFQNSIQGAVPQGHTFKGFPVSSTSLNDLQRKLMADVVGREVVLFPRAAHSQFGVAVKSIPYPEGVCVLWAMVAVVYKTA